MASASSTPRPCSACPRVTDHNSGQEAEPMRMYVLSLGAGLLVGVIYSLLDVRSPAPPLVALVGLFGILVGEQAIPVGKQLLAGSGLIAAWRAEKCTPHIF